MTGNNALERLTMAHNIYTMNGYANRTDYLRCMSEEYNVPFSTVEMCADLLGPNEDFDGLVNTLEDYESMYSCFN